MAPEKQDSILRRLARRPPQLEGGVELSIELEDDQHGLVRLRHDEVAAELRAVGLSLPYPSGLRRLLAGGKDFDLVVVERAPHGLRQEADDAGISYLDLTGRGRVVAPGLVYVATPRPGSGALALGKSSPFAPKAARVVRVLLSDPAKAWRLSDVAVLSDLNPGNVHRALGALVDRGVVERDEDAYLVADPGSLLEAWADQNQPPRERIVLRHDGDLLGAVRRLVGDLDGRAVVSGELAAELYAPHLPAQSAIVHALDPQSFADLPRPEQPRLLASLRVAPGQVVVDLADVGYGEFQVVKDQLGLASAQQVYVDLAPDRGRGREAAEHLRERVIGF